jgi:hypothetical protein
MGVGSSPDTGEGSVKRGSRTPSRVATAALKSFTTEIARKRRGVTHLQDDLGKMLDHLAVIEARAKSAGKKRYSTAEVKRALGI